MFMLINESAYTCKRKQEQWGNCEQIHIGETQ